MSSTKLTPREVELFSLCARIYGFDFNFCHRKPSYSQFIVQRTAILLLMMQQIGMFIQWWSYCQFMRDENIKANGTFCQVNSSLIFMVCISVPEYRRMHLLSLLKLLLQATVIWISLDVPPFICCPNCALEILTHLTYSLSFWHLKVLVSLRETLCGVKFSYRCL